MNRTEIISQASTIAGALWDDREKTGTLADQLRTAAGEREHGTEGDLTAEDRAALLSLADAAMSATITNVIYRLTLDGETTDHGPWGAEQAVSAKYPGAGDQGHIADDGSKVMLASTDSGYPHLISRRSPDGSAREIGRISIVHP